MRRIHGSVRVAVVVAATLLIVLPSLAMAAPMKSTITRVKLTDLGPDYGLSHPVLTSVRLVTFPSPPPEYLGPYLEVTITYDCPGGLWNSWYYDAVQRDSGLEIISVAEFPACGVPSSSLVGIPPESGGPITPGWTHLDVFAQVCLESGPCDTVRISAEVYVR